MKLFSTAEASMVAIISSVAIFTISVMISNFSKGTINLESVLLLMIISQMIYKDAKDAEQ